jgi:2-polyprenyl-3-methyl-5-hydroxy-6-metoxy-1,4-benzoquinol methylase
MSEQKSLVQTYYESHHETGNRLSKSILQEARGPLFASWIGQDKDILDLGGRDGTLTRYYMEGNNVTIADIDETALARANATYNVKTQRVNLNENLPFGDNNFDAIVMAEVLEHLPYPKITLSEIQRILKPGGEFIGNIPLAYHLLDRYRVMRGQKLLISGDPTHLQFMSYQDTIDLLENYFSVKEVVAIKGGKKADRFPALFARNIAFRCINDKK